ncbi:MAG: hypothetical protein AB1567_13275 [bacterium]
MYKASDIFSDIDRMSCAEQPAKYETRKLIPFYYNSELMKEI